MKTRYDQIGVNYAMKRRPDPRIAARIEAALGDAQTILNVGAGAGSYEPKDRDVTALEPSSQMIAQRPTGSARAIQGVAEDLPFGDGTFDAAMGILTIHHWSDQGQGLREMARVSRGPVVLLTYDPGFRDFWLLDYFPELSALDDGQMPPLPFYGEHLGPVAIDTVPIPHDCSDGFLSAYWRRPSAYLDEKVRSAMSSFWRIGDVSRGLNRLENDLADGTWDAAHGHLMDLPERDMGYRLVRRLT